MNQKPQQPAQSREYRVAAALRENLKRRKLQRQAREEKKQDVDAAGIDKIAVESPSP